MRSRVARHIAIRRAATEEPTLDRCLCGHGGTYPCLDPVAFALAHVAVEAHDEIVCVGAGIDRTADLGHLELDAVVDDEHRERESELVAVEGALRLSDDNGVPAAARIPEGVQQT